MDSKDLKIILAHGNHGGTGSDDWFPYVQKELEALGLEVMAPTFPDNEYAKESIWIPYLENELKANENTIIIGWSSGAVAAMRYAETHKIFGSVLVGTYYTDLDDEYEKIAGYCSRPWNWEAMKNNQQWVMEFASADDPYIPIDEARHIHEKLGTEYYEYTDRGHFMNQSEFPELVEALKKKLHL